MKKEVFFVSLFFLLAAFIFSPLKFASAQGLADTLSGRILIQVQQGGAVWYVNPADKRRYSLGVPADSLILARTLAVGISNSNLHKIPLGNLADKKIAAGNKLAVGSQGRFFQQVQDKGQLWYMNPLDAKRYLLASSSDLIALVRKTGLGISNNNLDKIPLGVMPAIKCQTLACLAALAATCQPGEETDSLTMPFPLAANEIANVNIHSQIANGVSAGSCSLLQQLRGGSITMTAPNRLITISSLANEVKLDLQISLINQILKSQAALNTVMACTGTGANLAAYLSDMAGGLGASDCLNNLGAPETDCIIPPGLSCVIKN
jgi:hypothetical protein